MPTHGRGQCALIPADLWYFRVLARITAFQTCGSELLEDGGFIYIVKGHKLVTFFSLGFFTSSMCLWMCLHQGVFFACLQASVNVVLLVLHAEAWFRRISSVVWAKPQLKIITPSPVCVYDSCILQQLTSESNKKLLLLTCVCVCVSVCA